MDRFDDVATEVLEAPEAPARRPRRRGLALGAVVLMAGALSGGALAHGESNGTAGTLAAPTLQEYKSGDQCEAGKSQRRAAQADLARRQ